MTTTLWHIEVAHYSEKARWALDCKGVAHRRKAPLPGAHRFVGLALTRGRHDRFPIVELAGRRIGDSTAIIAALEAAHPDPPLYPADTRERERALALEDFFDEHLAPDVRRFVWQHTLHHPDAAVALLMPRASARRQRVMRTLLPVARPAVRFDYTVNPEAAARSLEAVRAAMDRVEAELQPSGYLVGDRFSVADLTAAALFTPVLCPPQHEYAPRALAPAIVAVREELAARPGGAWVAEMYARHRGRSAEIRR